MNILIIGKFYTEGFALHIAETLSVMGHTVQRFEPGFRSGRSRGRLGQRLDQVRGVIHTATDSLPAIRARRIQSLWQIAAQAPLDLAIVCHDFLWPAEVAELKHRTGARVALWFPDHLGTIGRGFFMNAPYDGLFFKDPYIVHALSSTLLSPAYYLPECFNPDRHFLPESEIGDDPAYSCDIATAGNQHAWRVAIYKQLTEYDVKLWGNFAPLWLDSEPVAQMHQKRPVLNHDKVRAFRGAKIAINNLHYGEVWGINVRSFEIAGAGAFQLVDWRPGLDQLFKDGQELVSFRGIADLKAKIDYYLKQDAERQTIAKAGQERAHAEHTYRHRLDLLLVTLAGTAQGFPLPTIRYPVDHAQ